MDRLILFEQLILPLFIAMLCGAASFLFHMQKEDKRRNEEAHKRLGERIGKTEKDITKLETENLAIHKMINKLDNE